MSAETNLSVKTGDLDDELLKLPRVSDVKTLSDDNVLPCYDGRKCPIDLTYADLHE